jgi:hypothetical protein
MRLFAPPSMADDRVPQTEGTPAYDLFRTSRPVETWLAIIRRKWDKDNRLASEALPLSGTWQGISLRRAFFLLQGSFLKKERITQLP